MRRRSRILLAVIILVIGYPLFTAARVWHASTLDQAQPADAIVVLGAAQYNGKPSPVLRARLDHAAALWHRELAPRIVVTGGKVDGDAHTEAGASAQYLATKGVPDNAVLREVDGRTSWQSLQAAARFMKARDIHEIILVSDSFHSARIAAMSKSLDLDPRVSPATDSPIQGSEQLPYFAKEVVSLGLGQLLGFSRVAHLEENFSST